MSGLVALGAPPASAAGVRTFDLGAPAARAGSSRVSALPADGTANPSTNTVPSEALLEACESVGSTESDQDACDAAAESALDSVRASEGVGPITLPPDFAGMSAPVQLMVIANLERVDRGLTPVEGLATSLDSLAQSGADEGTDPPFPKPFDGTLGGGNWAGGSTSMLLDDFLWMYDDGYGSGNLACTAPTAPGCWGHRDNILNSYASPLVMGAATASTAEGPSTAEELIGGDTTDTVVDTVASPDWATVAATLPVGVSATTISAATDPGTAKTTDLTLWASGEDMDVTAAVTAGAPAWSVTTSGCDLPAGSECTATVTYDPPTSTPVDGTLTVTGPNGAQAISLTGARAALDLSVAASRSSVTAGAKAVISGTLETSIPKAALPGATLALYRRLAGSSTWVDRGSARTGAKGGVSFAIEPTANAAYELRFPAAAGYPATTSTTVTVDARSKVTVELSRSTVGKKAKVTLTGTVRPDQPGKPVSVDELEHGAWERIATRILGKTSTFSYAPSTTRSGTFRYRVARPATIANAAGSSETLTLHVT